ncbi:MAG TPA: type II CAAX endopeptidase family protein [Anaerolineales bacterium]
MDSTTSQEGRPVSSRARPGLFFFLVYGFTWLFWVPAAVWGAPEPDALTLMLHYLGGAMPFLVTLALLFLRHDRPFRLDFWRRAVDPRRIGWPWLAFTLLVVPALTGLAALADRLLGGPGLELEALARFSGQPLALLSYAVFLLLFGPLPEELAWRGYALDGLQRGWSALRASLALGLLWAGWHLPLFFIEGSYQSGRREPYFALLFALGILAQSVVMTWIYNNTHRSTLSAVLVHLMVNFVGELTGLSRSGEGLYILGWILLAVVVAVRMGRWGSEPAATAGQG